jgi:Flp pilus assembly protein TadD
VTSLEPVQKHAAAARPPLQEAARAVEAERWAEAKTFAAAAAAADPSSFEAWVLSGIACARSKDLREAVLCFQRALERRPLDLQTWVDLGECCLGINDYPRAGKALGRAIELDPRGEHPAGRRARALAGRAIVRLRAGK